MDKGDASYKKYLSGNDDGLVEIVSSYRTGLIIYINSYVNDIHTAEDLCEDTFFKIMVKKPIFIPKYSFKTWLYTIARNIALDYLRRKKTEFNIDEFSKEEERKYYKDNLKEDYYQLYLALDSIKEDYRQAIQLKYFDDFSNEEISRILKKDKRQIETLLYRGKRALKQQLEKIDDEK